jgi:hypothetical protein
MRNEHAESTCRSGSQNVGMRRNRPFVTHAIWSSATLSGRGLTGCLAAIYRARRDRPYFANSREDAARIGFDDARIGGELARDPDARELPSVRLFAAEARSVFDAWAVKPDKVRY